MPDPRLDSALRRIARALDRLEAAPRADPALPARHATLRTATQEAIGALDRLIADERA